MPNKQKLPPNFYKKSKEEKHEEEGNFECLKTLPFSLHKDEKGNDIIPKMKKNTTLRIYSKVSDFNDNIIYQSIKQSGKLSNKHIKEIHKISIMHARQQKIRKIHTPCKLEIVWYIPSRKSDVINYSIKQIIDGLIEAEILKDDNVNNILGRSDTFIIVKDKNLEGVQIDFVGV